MASLHIELSDEEVRYIEERARKLGLTPEELLRRGVQEWLKQSTMNFSDAASYVLEKNAELYKRLS